MMTIRTSVRIAIVVALFASALPVVACDCSAKVDRTSADLVFEGTASAGMSWQWTEDNEVRYRIRYRFDNVALSKGPRRRSFLLDTTDSDCGFRFVPGKRYRVFAVSNETQEAEWLVSICSETQVVSAPRK